MPPQPLGVRTTRGDRHDARASARRPGPARLPAGAHLIAEAGSLTEVAALATPAELARERLPPRGPLARPLDAARTAAAVDPPPVQTPPPPRRDDPESVLAELDAALDEH